MIASFFYLNPDLNGRFTQLVRRISCGVLTAVCLASTMAQANDQISVGTVSGKDIWLDDVLRAAERLPEEFQQTPLENYYAQLVADIIDSQLAAAAARNDGFDKKPEIADAMKMAANRVLAESWLAEKVRSDVTETAIQNAYDKFVADTASREQVTASHILVETEADAKAVIAALQDGGILPHWPKKNQLAPAGQMVGRLAHSGAGKWCLLLKQPLLTLLLAVTQIPRYKRNLAGMSLKLTAKTSRRHQTLNRCARNWRIIYQRRRLAVCLKSFVLVRTFNCEALLMCAKTR